MAMGISKQILGESRSYIFILAKYRSVRQIFSFQSLGNNVLKYLPENRCNQNLGREIPYKKIGLENTESVGHVRHLYAVIQIKHMLKDEVQDLFLPAVPTEGATLQPAGCRGDVSRVFLLLLDQLMDRKGVCLKIRRHDDQMRAAAYIDGILVSPSCIRTFLPEDSEWNLLRPAPVLCSFNGCQAFFCRPFTDDCDQLTQVLPAAGPQNNINCLFKRKCFIDCRKDNARISIYCFYKYFFSISYYYLY